MTITPYVPDAATSLLPRGNLLLQSQTLGTTWALTAGSVTANSVADIYGLTTGDTLTRTATTASHIHQSVTKAGVATTYTLSWYAQILSGNFFAMRLSDGSTNHADVCFNLSTGAISTAASVTGSFSNASASIALVAGTSWYRCTLICTSNTATTIEAFGSCSSVSQQVDGTGSTNSTTVYLWGAQLEAYAQASAYAATVAAADSGIWAGVQSLAVLPRLPGQAITISKAPKWSTEVIMTASGRRRATAYWPYPLWQFELQLNALRKIGSVPSLTTDELVTLWEFFNAAQGQFGRWLYVDTSDCAIAFTSPATFGTGDGATKAFQIGRYLNSVYEPVYAAYQPVILDNGAPTASTLAFSANGVVTFGTAPTSGHTLSWFGYFYFGCAFTQDDLTADQVLNLLWAGKKVAFSSLRA